MSVRRDDWEFGVPCTSLGCYEIGHEPDGRCPRHQPARHCQPGEMHSHKWIAIRTTGPGPDEPRLVDRYCDLCKKRPLDVLTERQIVPE